MGTSPSSYIQVPPPGVVSVLAIGYTMLGKTLIKMSPPSLSKFDVEDGVKLVAIVAMSDFTKDYLIKQKIIPDNI